MKVDCQLLEASADATELLEPADALLDHRAAAISLAVELHFRVPPRQLVVLVRDHRLDLLPPDPVAQAHDAVAFVADELFRFVPAFSLFSSASDQTRDRLADDRLGAGALVHLPGGDFGRERIARAVSNQVELRSKPASAAAQRVVRRLVRVPGKTFLSAPAAARAARTIAPSTHHSSQSIRPRSSSLICKASMTLAKTPLLRQLRKWSYTVCQGPKRLGKSRHGAPVPRIQKMPLSISRGSLGGRPVRAIRRRTCDSTNAHCSSMSSCRCILADLHLSYLPDQMYAQQLSG